MAQTIGKKSEGKIRFRAVWAESGSILAGGGAALGFVKHFLFFLCNFLLFSRGFPFFFSVFLVFFHCFFLVFWHTGGGGWRILALFCVFSGLPWICLYFPRILLVFSVSEPWVFWGKPCFFLVFPGGFTEN